MRSTGKTDRLEPGSTLVSSVSAYLSDHGIPDGAHTLIAFSGGPDSTALVAALHELMPVRSFSLHCAYFDHGIRSRAELDAELEFVRGVCAKLGLPLVFDRIEPGRIAEEARVGRKSVEDTARQYRYQFLYGNASRLGCGYIALGHTRDDQSETMIMRFFQGCGVGGLSGIPPRRDRLIRPLIACTRAEVLEYLASGSTGYMTDSSNGEQDYLRNRVRLSLMPVADTLFPGFRKTLSGLAGRMDEVNRFLTSEAAARIRWVRSVRSYTTEKAPFFAAPPLLRVQSVYSVFNLVTDRDGFRLPSRFLNPVRTRTPAAGDAVLLKGYGFILRTAGNLIFAEEDIVIDSKTGYSISIDIDEKESTRSISGLLSVSIRTSSLAMYTGDSPWIPVDCIQPPLVLRSRKPGDVLFTEIGSKEVSKLLSEWKIPLGLRPLVPVLEDGNGILGVLGSPFGYRNRFSERCTGSRLPDKIIKIISVQLYGV